MCTINEDHVIYGSWNIKCDRQKVLSFWAIFCPFSPLTTRKIKILKLKKIPGDTVILQIFMINDNHMMYVPEIWSATDRIFCHSGPFFALLPHYVPRKSKFWKNKKHNWRCYHFTNVYHKWQSYDVLFLRYRVQQTEFLLFWTIFYPFISLTTQKSKFCKKKKKHLEILSFYTCVL